MNGSKLTVSNLKFSVFVTVYSGVSPKVFELSLRSIFRNTLMPSEVILVIDGPVDFEIKKIIAKFSNRMNVYSFENNQGAALAANYAIKQCKYDWIIKHDSDDFSFRNRFSTLISYIHDEPALFGTNMCERYNYKKKIRRVPIDEKSIKKIIKYRNPFNNPTVCFHKKIFQEIGGYPVIAFKEDWAFWIKAIKRFKCYNIDQTLVSSINSTEMFRRRRGLKNLISEFKIQQLCIKNGFSNIFESTFIYLFRTILLLLPNSLIKVIYTVFLRNNV